MTTQDLALFGNDERRGAADLLKEWADNSLPDNFALNDVSLVFNQMSGFVFLTNADCQTVLFNPSNGEIEEFYSCPECGHEGFFDEMPHNEDNPECQEYLNEIKEVTSCTK